jgi:hypothetical protein
VFSTAIKSPMLLRILCSLSGIGVNVLIGLNPLIPVFTITTSDESVARKRPEDSIPVVEIRGEGKPMTPAQIRALEEASNGGPLDIKVEKTWVPAKCPHAAKRLDFLTFHYKGFLEDGKKFDQTYGRVPIRLQLGTGMVLIQ